MKFLPIHKYKIEFLLQKCHALFKDFLIKITFSAFILPEEKFYWMKDARSLKVNML